MPRSAPWSIALVVASAVLSSAIARADDAILNEPMRMVDHNATARRASSLRASAVPIAHRLRRLHARTLQPDEELVVDRFRPRHRVPPPACTGRDVGLGADSRRLPPRRLASGMVARSLDHVGNRRSVSSRLAASVVGRSTSATRRTIGSRADGPTEWSACGIGTTSARRPTRDPAPRHRPSYRSAAATPRGWDWGPQRHAVHRRHHGPSVQRRLLDVHGAWVGFLCGLRQRLPRIRIADGPDAVPRHRHDGQHGTRPDGLVLVPHLHGDGVRHGCGHACRLVRQRILCRRRTEARRRPRRRSTTSSAARTRRRRRHLATRSWSTSARRSRARSRRRRAPRCPCSTRSAVGSMRSCVPTKPVSTRSSPPTPAEHR